VLPFAARCTSGSVARGTADAMLQTEIVFDGAIGPQLPLADHRYAATQLHQTGRSCAAQHFLG
jgi:hypothetical protein